jgi:hypothetical protein
MSGEYRVVTSHMLPTMFHHISGHFFSDQNTPWIYEYIYIRDMCGGGLCVASDDTNVSTLLTCVTADDTIVSTLLTCVAADDTIVSTLLTCVVVDSVWRQMTLLCQHHFYIWTVIDTSSPSVSLWGSCRSFVFCVVFCTSLCILLSLSFWPLCNMFFFQLRFLFTLLVSVKPSCHHIILLC